MTSTNAARGAMGLAAQAVSPTPGGEARWRALHTRSRHERAVTDALGAAGIGHYMPVVRRTRVYGHRRRVVELPLFSCYVFMHGTDEDARFALETGRIARSLPIADQERFEREIGMIREALARGGALELCAYLQRGKRVRVRSGPFKGIEGVIEERGRGERMSLQIHAMQRATSLEIDAALLDPAE